MKVQFLIVSLMMSLPVFSQQNDANRPGVAMSSFSVHNKHLEVYTLPTGTIQIHSCHYQNCKGDKAPYIFRFIKILKDTSHVAPIPINTYLIKHPEGNFLIDAGGDLKWNNLGSRNCDKISGKISRKIANVDVRPNETILSRLNEIGVAPSDINAAIITHLHFDHTAGHISRQNTKSLI